MSRSLPALFDSLSDAAKERLRSRSQPRWIEPMLATLHDEPFSDDGWIYERKLDGVRCLVFRRGRRLRLLSRNRNDMSASWPELVEQLRQQELDDFVADGEIVAFDGGRTSFARLQHRIGLKAGEAERRRVAVHIYLFDILHAAGHATDELRQRDRKALLRRALSSGGRVHHTPHRNGDGVDYLRACCAKGWEGLIAKDAAAAYVHARSRKWLKLKCVHGQELVVAGYTEPHGSRQGFGALLVGYYEDGALRYAGKVGTGFDDATLQQLAQRLRRLERKTSPFADEVDEDEVHYVRPELVGEFRFTEWTDAGRLRHPRFVGLRTDKDPDDVRRERPGG